MTVRLSATAGVAVFFGLVVGCVLEPDVIGVGGGSTSPTSATQASGLGTAEADDTPQAKPCGAVCTCDETPCRRDCEPVVEGTGCILTCPENTSCEFNCDDGPCVVICEPGSSCTVACPGGGCDMTCTEADFCDMICAPGGRPCAGHCVDTDCTLGCPQGQCSLNCTGQGSCVVTDCDDDCVTTCDTLDPCPDGAP